MNLNLIKHFLAAYDFKSISKAAEHMNMTQPSMTAAIKNFEEQSGKIMFYRTSRSIQPTEEAHYLAEQCREILGRLDSVFQEERKLKVCCPEAIMQSLPGYDGVHFVETPAVEYSILDQIRTGEVDIVIDDISIADHSFVVESIGSQKLALACRKNHPTIGDTITLEQFKSAEHIMLRLKNKNVSALETRTEETFNRNVVREVSGQSNLLLNARNSDAVCIVSESMFGLAEELGLKVLEPPFALRDYEMKMIYHKRNINNHQHTLVREHIKKHLQPK
ncbi:LysR family transcriptional regulator [Vibrio satsumensis]|uniref:LysR family transcriptional regulator n=1 Tax=Vibrio satsumensis TaxID=2910245 RepID=UPI003D0FE94E